MFPGNELSNPTIPGAFIGAGASSAISRTYDCEDGPIAEQDASRGLNYQQWRAYVREDKVWLEADNTPARVLIDEKVTDISIAFSQNADLHYVWVDSDGVARFRWFDATTSSFQIMELPEGTRTPKCTLDDKRMTQLAASDIILSYLNADGALFFRMQRDRFQIEYPLHPGPWIGIDRMYMGNRLRLQWAMMKAMR